MKQNIKLFAVAVLALSCCILFTVGDVFFSRASLLPLDQLNTTISPYSHGVDTLKLKNHFLQDAITQYYPYKQMSALGLASLFKPVWNPLWFGGYPHYTDTMAGHFDITNILLLIKPLHIAYHLQIFVQFLIAASGMYVLLIRLRVHELLALLGAIAFMLNSLFISTLLHRWIIAAFCWSPWMLVALHCYCIERSTRFGLLTAVCYALGMMEGNIQPKLYLSMVLAIVGIAWLYDTRVSWMKNIASVVKYGGMIALMGFLLSMIMWMPHIETLLAVKQEGIQASSRMGATLSLKDRILSFAFLITFFIPQLAGSVRAFDFTKIFQGDLFDYQGFIGFIPAVCAIFGAIYYWNKRTELRPFIVLLLLGTLVPIWTPLYQFVYYRIFIIAILAMCILGTVALNDILMNDTVERAILRRLLLIASSTLGLAVAGIIIVNLVGIFFQDKLYALAFNYIDARKPLGPPARVAWFLNRVNTTFQHFSLSSPTMWMPIVSGFVGLWILFRSAYQYKLSSQYASVILIALTSMQLIVQARAWLPLVDTQQYPLYPATAETDFLLYDSTKYRAMTFTGSSPNANPVFMRNILSVYGIETFDGLASLMPRTALKLAGEGSAFGIYPDPNNVPANFLGLYNVKYLTVDTAWKPRDTVAWHRAFAGKEVNIWQNMQCLPRAFMAYQYAVASSDSAMKHALYDSVFQAGRLMFEQEPMEKISVSADTLSALVLSDSAQQPKVVITDYQHNAVFLNVFTPCEGYLFLSDAYYNGWKAYVDGVETHIYRANYAGRSIVVPEGKHRIVFAFEPKSYRVGAWISSLSLLVCVLGIIILPSRQRKE